LRDPGELIPVDRDDERAVAAARSTVTICR
jgi:hypothetical protein